MADTNSKYLIELIIGMIVFVTVVVSVGFYFKDQVFSFFKNLGGDFILGLI